MLLHSQLEQAACSLEARVRVAGVPEMGVPLVVVAKGAAVGVHAKAAEADAAVACGMVGPGGAIAGTAIAAIEHGSVKVWIHASTAARLRAERIERAARHALVSISIGRLLCAAVGHVRRLAAVVKEVAGRRRVLEVGRALSHGQVRVELLQSRAGVKRSLVESIVR